ncbi:MAG: murein hydrolase activator EnvC family protein [Alphaproteobacteria bacterium]
MPKKKTWIAFLRAKACCCALGFGMDSAHAQESPSPSQETRPSFLDEAGSLGTRKNTIQNHLNLLTLRLESLKSHTQCLAEKLQRDQQIFSSFFFKQFFSLRETPTAIFAHHIKPEAYVHALALSTSILQKMAQSLRQVKKKEAQHKLQTQAAQAELRRYQLVLSSLERNEKTANSGKSQLQSDFEFYSEKAYQLELPAEGTFVAPPVTSATGEKVSIQTTFLAPVMCPASGKITYIGPLKGIKQALIIDHGGKHYSILSGFEKIHVHAGDALFQGETVATMAGYGKDNPILDFEFLKPAEESKTIFLKAEEKIERLSLGDGL